MQNKVQVIQLDVSYHANPAETFYNICHEKKRTLLLESAEIVKKNQLESMLIIDTAIRITAINRKVILESFSKNGQNILDKIHTVIPPEVQFYPFEKKIELIFPNIINILDEDNRLQSLSVFDCFRFILKLIKSSKNQSKSIFFGGLFSYDLINTFENISDLPSIQKCPDFCFYLSEILLTFDHLKKKSIIQGSIFFDDMFEKERIIKRLLKIKKQLCETPLSIPQYQISHASLEVNINDVEYQKIVKKMQYYIKKGEIFQVVPSRKFFLPCPYPLSAYYILKLENPSPYMFFMQDEDFILFGASPESSLKYNSKNRKIEIYPIAGTRSRGFDTEGKLNLDLDSRIELEMRTNEKELSEHLMLVDLARNDLAKICIPGTRFVSNLTQVDRYSHVMHLVSRVIGILKNDLDALHAYSACMNMGTLSGAPKVRAMQLIAQVEQEKRGSYGGAIGYFTGLGDLNTCIVIRSAYIENNLATIQSGAGIVLDSIPQDESDESRNKAQAVLNSIIQSNYKKV
ncbi:Anthranilate synthase component 1 [Buchnera aphidicola (Phyllaphis fagi)]|uniref:anthranilate synthase component 1 n=1 Tax=Buchnera aphidicola TaxID=9 RepID=UPI00346459E0